MRQADYRSILILCQKALVMTDTTKIEFADMIGYSRPYVNGVLNEALHGSDRMMLRMKEAANQLLTDCPFARPPQYCAWKRRLKAKKITQEDAAEAIGVTRTYLSAALNGARVSPKLENRIQSYMKSL